MKEQLRELLNTIRTTPADSIELRPTRGRLSISELTGEELAEAFTEIPANITTLDLTDNNLSDKSGAELATAFRALPAHITTLDLHQNVLGHKSWLFLKMAFRALRAYYYPEFS